MDVESLPPMDSLIDDDIVDQENVNQLSYDDNVQRDDNIIITSKSITNDDECVDVGICNISGSQVSPSIYHDASSAASILSPAPLPSDYNYSLLSPLKQKSSPKSSMYRSNQQMMMHDAKVVEPSTKSSRRSIAPTVVASNPLVSMTMRARIQLLEDKRHQLMRPYMAPSCASPSIKRSSRKSIAPAAHVQFAPVVQVQHPSLNTINEQTRMISTLQEKIEGLMVELEQVKTSGEMKEDGRKTEIMSLQSLIIVLNDQLAALKTTFETSTSAIRHAELTSANASMALQISSQNRALLVSAHQSKNTYAPWMLASQCVHCHSAFKFWGNRRHHCRSCGDSVCGKCSTDKCMYLTQSSQQAVRACKDCIKHSSVKTIMADTKFVPSASAAAPRPRRSSTVPKQHVAPALVSAPVNVVVAVPSAPPMAPPLAPSMSAAPNAPPAPLMTFAPPAPPMTFAPPPLTPSRPDSDSLAVPGSASAHMSSAKRKSARTLSFAPLDRPLSLLESIKSHSHASLHSKGKGKSRRSLAAIAKKSNSMMTSTTITCMTSPSAREGAAHTTTSPPHSLMSIIRSTMTIRADSLSGVKQPAAADNRRSTIDPLLSPPAAAIRRVAPRFSSSPADARRSSLTSPGVSSRSGARSAKRALQMETTVETTTTTTTTQRRAEDVEDNEWTE